MPRLKAKPSFARLLEHPLEDDARAHLVGLAVEGEIGRIPHDFRLPGQLHAAVQVGQAGDLVVIRRLAEAIQRVAGVELRAAGEILEMRDGHDFALRHAVEIDIGAHAIFHPFGDQVLFRPARSAPVG